MLTIVKGKGNMSQCPRHLRLKRGVVGNKGIYYIGVIGIVFPYSLLSASKKRKVKRLGTSRNRDHSPCLILLMM